MDVNVAHADRFKCSIAHVQRNLSHGGSALSNRSDHFRSKVQSGSWSGNSAAYLCKNSLIANAVFGRTSRRSLNVWRKWGLTQLVDQLVNWYIAFEPQLTEPVFGGVINHLSP